MGPAGTRRTAQAIVIATVTVPCVLFAHLLTTGTVASGAQVLACVAAVVALTGVVRASGRVGVALLTGAAQLGGHLVLGLVGTTTPGTRGCLAAVGRGAEIGVHLAVFRQHPDCPSGTFAPGTTLTASLAAVSSAVVIVAGHAVVAAATGSLLALARGLRALAVRARSLVVSVLHEAALRLPVPDRIAPPRPSARRPRERRRGPEPALLRGPPALSTPA